MHRRARTLVAVTVLVLCAGCADRETDQVRKVGAKALAKVEALASAASNKLGLNVEQTQAQAEHLTLPARVRARLRWDQALVEADIRVQADGGAVTLTGSVRTDEQRRRAVELAESTVGVNAVTERLTVMGKGE